MPWKMAKWFESGSASSDSLGLCYARNLKMTVIDTKQHNNVIKQDGKETLTNSVWLENNNISRQENSCTFILKWLDI